MSKEISSTTLMYSILSVEEGVNVQKDYLESGEVPEDEIEYEEEILGAKEVKLNTAANNIIDNINALSPLVANKVLESMSSASFSSHALSNLSLNYLFYRTPFSSHLRL